MTVNCCSRPGLERRTLPFRLYARLPTSNRVAGTLPRSVPVRSTEENVLAVSVDSFGLLPPLSAALKAMDIKNATEIQVQEPHSLSMVDAH
jgi:hypothetical protein